MRGINYVLLGGNIGRDPEIKYLPNGTEVATFSLAISQKWKDNSGESKEKTDWIRIVAYKGNAEIVEKFLSKGDSVLVIGRLSIRKWEDRDGKPKETVEIVAKEISFVKVKNKNGSESAPGPGSGPGPDDDVPF